MSIEARSIVLLCFFWIAGTADPSAAECAARALAVCPGGVASGAFFAGDPVDAKGRVMTRATVSSPYLIDGLVRSDLLAGFERRSISMWIDWRHLGFELYREDRFSAAVGFPCPAAPAFRLYACPGIERRAARGFPAVESYALSIACSRDIGGNGCLGFVCRPGVSGDAEAERARIFLIVRTASLAIAVDRAVSGPRGRDVQCAIEVRVDSAVALETSYRRETGEASSGIALRVSRATLDFSWSWHPALGCTASIGVGRSW